MPASEQAGSDARPDLQGRRVVLLATLLYAALPFSTDAYSPVLTRIGQAMAVPPQAVQGTLTWFILAFALCQLVWGPVADRIGRRPVILIAFAIYTAGSLLCLYATEIDRLVLGRVIQGLGAAAGPVVGLAIIRDVYGAAGSGRMFATISTAMAAFPLLGPLATAELAVRTDWWGAFLLLTLYGVVVLLLASLMPETRPAGSGGGAGPGRMLRQLAGLLGRGRFLCHALIHAMGYCAIFTMVAGLNPVLAKGLEQDPRRFAFGFATGVVGYAIGTLLVRRWLSVGVPLPVAMLRGLGAMALALALLQAEAAGWLPAESRPERVVQITLITMLFVFGCGILLPASMTGAVRPHPDRAGAASALLGFLRGILAFALGMAVAALHDGSTMVFRLSWPVILAIGTGLLLILQTRFAEEPQNA